MSVWMVGWMDSWIARHVDAAFMPLMTLEVLSLQVHAIDMVFCLALKSVCQIKATHQHCIERCLMTALAPPSSDPCEIPNLASWANK